MGNPLPPGDLSNRRGLFPSPPQGHERVISTLFQASAVASRSFSIFLLFLAFAPSGNKHHCPRLIEEGQKMFEARQAAACAVSGEPQEEATAFERELERLIAL